MASEPSGTYVGGRGGDDVQSWGSINHLKHHLPTYIFLLSSLPIKKETVRSMVT